MKTGILTEIIRGRILSILFLLFAISLVANADDSIPAKGKWDGKFELMGGSDFKRQEDYEYIFSHSQSKVNAAFGYTAPKFAIHSKTDAESSLHFTECIGGTAIERADSTYKVDLDLTYKQTITWKVNSELTADYIPVSTDPLHFYYRYKYLNDNPDKGIVRINNLTDSAISIDAGITSEKVEIIKHTFQGGVSHKHLFEKVGRMLSTAVDLDFTTINSHSVWDVETVSQFAEKETIYRLTPHYFDDEVKTSIQFLESRIGEIEGLDLEASLFFRFKGDVDQLRAANLINQVWMDSVPYHEDFRFHTYLPAPRMKLSFTRNIYHIDAFYMPEFYIYDLSGDGFKGVPQTGPVAHFVNLNAYVTPWNYHRFTLQFDRKVKRPDYLQICWFDRGGAYAYEIYRGNPELLPSATNKAGFLYNFDYKGISLKTEANLTYEKNKIEQTYSTEGINGHDYRIYTWINSDKSYTTNLKLNLTWTGKYVKVGAGGQYNYFFGKKLSGTETRNSDYIIDGLAAFNMKGWTLEAKAKYQSKIIRNYHSMTEIVGLDARFGKAIPFGENGAKGTLGLYIEGKDLLDKDIEITTISADETQIRYEIQSNNKRIVLMHITYQF